MQEQLPVLPISFAHYGKLGTGNAIRLDLQTKPPLRPLGRPKDSIGDNDRTPVIALPAASDFHHGAV